MVNKKTKKRKKRKTANNLVEIARAFSYKLNLGNFTNADFFCSEKTTALKKDAEKTSEALYLFCKSEVVKSVNSYLKENGKAQINTLKAELLAELKKWFAEGGDKKQSNYGKELAGEKQERESKLEEIKVEEEIAEELKR